jgi:hypothetical protein
MGIGMSFFRLFLKFAIRPRLYGNLIRIFRKFAIRIRFIAGPYFAFFANSQFAISFTGAQLSPLSPIPCVNPKKKEEEEGKNDHANCEFEK